MHKNFPEFVKNDYCYSGKFPNEKLNGAKSIIDKLFIKNNKKSFFI